MSTQPTFVETLRDEASKARALIVTQYKIDEFVLRCGRNMDTAADEIEKLQARVAGAEAEINEVRGLLEEREKEIEKLREQRDHFMQEADSLHLDRLREDGHPI